MAKRIGLALGTGGARGWCHIGVLRALEEMGLRPDAIAGSSMGALVGAAYAGGCLDALEDWARALTPRAVWGMIDMRLTGGGIVGGASITAMIEEIGLNAQIEDLAIPFTAIATDMQSGREIWLQKGPVAQAARASVAIPGVLSPSLIDGRWLIDGGVVNPVPVTPLHAVGVDVVIAVNPNGAVSRQYWHPDQDKSRLPDMGALMQFLPEQMQNLGSLWGSDDAETQTPPPSYMSLVNATIDIMSDRIRRARLAADAPQVMIAARLPDMSLLDFHDAPDAIEEGRRATLAQADWLETLLGRSA